MIMHHGENIYVGPPAGWCATRQSSMFTWARAHRNAWPTCWKAATDGRGTDDLGLNAGYGQQLVIKDLSLSFGTGDFIGLIGPNGHGKTTLLRTISGLVRAQRGSITFDGAELNRLRPDEIVAAGIVHVPQGDLLFPELTVTENLRMGAYLPEAAKQAGENA